MSESPLGPLEPIIAALNRLHDRLDRLDPVAAAKASEPLTVADFAKAVDRMPFTVRQWCNHGRIEADRTENGREWRIPPEELARYRRHGLRPSRRLPHR
jgi:hypothetical protein